MAACEVAATLGEIYPEHVQRGKTAMARNPRPMALTAFIMPSGYYKGSWRLPGSRAEEIGTLDFITDLVRTCEAAKLDAVFFGDLLNASTVREGNIQTSGFYEPLTTLAALAARTTRIGLIGTISTTFSLPYVTARQLSGLDSLSAGRAGWNVVTSWLGGENFGLDAMPPVDERYRRAAEFVEVTTKLWDSWSDDAVGADRERGVWADKHKIRDINHTGEFFSVQGALNMPRSPQGHPVIAQAGSSSTGMDLGASIGEMIYTAQPSKAKGIEFYSEFKRRVLGFGRDPQGTKIIPGIIPIVGRTDAEAREFATHLEENIDVIEGRDDLAHRLGLSLDDLEPDDRVPPERFASATQRGSRFEIYRHLAVEERLTVRELVIEEYRSGAHLSVTGSASKIADLMIDWFEDGACDGFSLNAPNMPDGLQRICSLLVPELRDRGYFRSEYEGTTLREHLGLLRPAA